MHVLCLCWRLRVFAFLCSYLLAKVEHLQVPLAGNLVDTDKAGLLDSREQTFHVGVPNGIQFQGIECRSQQRRMSSKAPVIIDHGHQTAIEHLRFPTQLIDSLTGQNSFSEDPVRHS